MSQEVMQSRPIKVMGNNFDITLVAKDSISTNGYIDAVISGITRIEQLIASWDTNYQTSEIYKNGAVHPVKLDKELLT